MLDLRHLRTIKAISETGSVSRAAQVLNVTQSALSHQLKALEDHFDTQLFERRSAPVAFSAAGGRLLRLAETAIAQFEAAERDIRRMAAQGRGMLRIAVECHTCFDWLMPAMDSFRQRWPEVELDIISGFHADPIGLLHKDLADLAIVSEDTSESEDDIRFAPLFRFDFVAVLQNGHPLSRRPFLRPVDFRGQTLVTYPVPDDMLDIFRRFLKPAGIEVTRRTTELTAAILQLVASGRGISALPLWAAKSYVDRGYVMSRPIGAKGLSGDLFASTAQRKADLPYVTEFVRLVRDTCLGTLAGVRPLPER